MMENSLIFFFKAEEHQDIISQMAKLIDTIEVRRNVEMQLSEHSL